MNRIDRIQREKAIDYSSDILDYFVCERNRSNLISYEKIIDKIKNATFQVNIASTSKVDNAIIDALYQNSDINIYMILKSFDKSKDTLSRFDERKPAIIREVTELENDFIIIDNISYIFINPLSNKENLIIKFDEIQSKDLKYLFNYYFWDCAINEKLVNKIYTPIASPFPPIGKRELDNINISTNEDVNFTSVYIPRDKKYENILNIDIEDRYFSDDLKCVLYKKDNLLKIGNFIFTEKSFNVENIWKLEKNSLSNISSNIGIIPKSEDWNNTLKLQDTKEITLGIVTSETIEKMQETEPQEFKKEQYIKNILYKWEVIPPLKLKDSKKANLYNEYGKLSEEYQKQLEILEKKLNELIHESSIISQFLGANKKAKDKLKQVNTYKEANLTELSHQELDDYLNKFESFKNDIEASRTDFKEDKKREEQKEKWENEKVQKEKILEKKQKEIENDKAKLLQTKEKTQEFIKLEKEIKRGENNLDSLKKEIDDNYIEFKYNLKQNEIKNLNKNINRDLEKLVKPKYSLPEVGVLYETTNSYYLEIKDYSELEEANNLKQRYQDKDYKVVGIRDE